MGTSIRPHLVLPAPTPPLPEDAFPPTRSKSWPDSSPRSLSGACPGLPFPNCRPRPMTVSPHPSRKACSSPWLSIDLPTRNCGTPPPSLPSGRSRIPEKQPIARASHQDSIPDLPARCIRTRTSPLESEPCHFSREASSPLPRARQTMLSAPGSIHSRAAPRRDRRRPFRQLLGRSRVCSSHVESPSPAASSSVAAPTSPRLQSCYSIRGCEFVMPPPKALTMAASVVAGWIPAADGAISPRIWATVT